MVTEEVRGKSITEVMRRVRTLETKYEGKEPKRRGDSRVTRKKGNFPEDQDTNEK